MEPQIRYCTTSDGVNIAYHTLGEGPAIIVLPGVWSDLVGWWPFREAGWRRIASLGLRVVLYDSRGCGSSDRQPIDASLEARIRDLEAVVDHLRLETFALFGAHFGAAAAIGYAANHADRITQLVLIDPYYDGEEVYQSVPQMKGFESMRELAADQWEMFTLVMANANTAYRDSDRAREMARVMRNAVTPAAHRALIDATRGINLETELRRLMAPALVVHLEDSFVPIAMARRAAASTPGCRFATAKSPPGGNFSDEFIDTLAAFMDKRTSSTTVQPAPFRIVFFTDIESNTALLQRLGDDAWRATLREFERMTRDALATHGGAEIKTMGDGFMASFASATRAVECAISLQRAVATHNGDSSTPVLVRIGLNAGEPIAEGDDLFGTAVTTAARIMGDASGGEILVSDVVRQLVAGKGFEFFDRGDVVLRGFDDPVRLYEVRVPD